MRSWQRRFEGQWKKASFEPNVVSGQYCFYYLFLILFSLLFQQFSFDLLGRRGGGGGRGTQWGEGELEFAACVYVFVSTFNSGWVIGRSGCLPIRPKGALAALAVHAPFLLCNHVSRTKPEEDRAAVAGCPSSRFLPIFSYIPSDIVPNVRGRASNDANLTV